MQTISFSVLEENLNDDTTKMFAKKLKELRQKYQKTIISKKEADIIWEQISSIIEKEKEYRKNVLVYEFYGKVILRVGRSPLEIFLTDRGFVFTKELTTDDFHDPEEVLNVYSSKEEFLKSFPNCESFFC